MENLQARMSARHRARLRELEAEDRLTPERVLEDARSETSPLHDLFDWDVEKAARRHWLDRSREIIGAFRVSVEVKKTIHVIPRYVEDPDKLPGAQGYVSMDAVKQDDMLARRVLIAECNRVIGAVTRARGIAAAVDMQDAFEDLLRRVVGIRERVEKDLGRPGLGREKVLATVVRLLEMTLIRVGNEEYVRENRSFGLTTLRTQHVDVDGTTIKFEFRAKSGKMQSIKLRDRRLARIVKACIEMPGKELFQYIDEAGERRSEVTLSMRPFRRLIKDYFLICESYFQAIRSATPSRIEAIDMGRRGLHNEGAELLRKRLDGKIDVDFDTARRLFTLICVLHQRLTH